MFSRSTKIYLVCAYTVDILLDFVSSFIFLNWKLHVSIVHYMYLLGYDDVALQTKLNDFFLKIFSSLLKAIRVEVVSI